MIALPSLNAPSRSSAWFVHPGARRWRCTAPATTAVQDFHAALPGYAPTPLAELPALATELGVGRIFVKDESSRLGLPSFKVLGVSWAVHRLLSRRSPSALPVRLVTATDGNHGRAVARTARLLGHRAQVFVPYAVGSATVAAIAAEGAEVSEVAGSYDEAVHRAAQAADEPDAMLVQDTAWPGYEEIPGWIVEGYSTLFAEIDAQLRETGVESPDLVVVPVGVGSLAQAAIAHYRSRPMSGQAPALLAVEPDTAACVLASLRQRQRVSITTGATAMAGLNCGTPSSLAWPYLRDGLDAAIAITDTDSARAARTLAALGISAGPCGAATLAATQAALADDAHALVDMGAAPTVVLLNTEGAVQPAAAQPAAAQPAAAQPATAQSATVQPAALQPVAVQPLKETDNDQP